MPYREPLSPPQKAHRSNQKSEKKTRSSPAPLTLRCRTSATTVHAARRKAPCKSASPQYSHTLAAGPREAQEHQEPSRPHFSCSGWLSPGFQSIVSAHIVYFIASQAGLEPLGAKRRANSPHRPAASRSFRAGCERHLALCAKLTTCLWVALRRLAQPSPRHGRCQALSSTPVAHGLPPRSQRPAGGAALAAPGGGAARGGGGDDDASGAGGRARCAPSIGGGKARQEI